MQIFKTKQEEQTSSWTEKQFIELLLSVYVNMYKNMLMFMSWDTKNCHIVANSKHCLQKFIIFLHIELPRNTSVIKMYVISIK